MLKIRFHKVRLCLMALSMLLTIPALVGAQTDDPSPPAQPVKLIFIHHSTGENWLSDDDGGLGRALEANNYFASDTNYGWGPDSIGDRTDITDWPEWFTGPDSNRYLTALYAETGQLAPYTRSLPEPSGENQIIMFKSCFPNSNLEGNSNDPPARGWGLTVSNTKAIYNELLTYFATRHDKLFVVITAPPLQDPTHAANARAFNTWLVEDWLSGYEGNNVAVFDFYNVLTDPDNHHRVRDGAVEHITARGGNTLYYPSNGDDHPSSAGNRKATGEFVPLLNAYYHRWQRGAPAAGSTTTPTPAPPTPVPEPTQAQEPPTSTPEPTTEEVAPPPEPPLMARGVIDDFESDASRWDVFLDMEKDTHLACGPDKGDSYSGSTGLRVEYDVAPESWATCALVYPSPQNWNDGQGVAVYLRAERVGQQAILIAYQGESSDALLHFEFRMETNQEAVDGWQRVDVPWDHFVQPPWQGDSSTPFDPGRAMGLALLFDAPTGERNSGTLWLDDVSFLSAVPSAAPTVAPPKASIEATPMALTEPPAPTESTILPEPTQPAAEPGEEKEGGGLCPGSAALGAMILVGAVWSQQPRHRKR